VVVTVVEVSVFVVKVIVEPKLGVRLLADGAEVLD
jgi:hypothetical protein